MAKSSKPALWIAIGAAALGMLGGFMLGGIQPRSELVEAEREIARLEEEVERGGSRWRSPVPGLDRILQLPSEDSADERGPRTDRRAEDSTEPDRDAGASEPEGFDAGNEQEERPSWRERWRERADERSGMEGFERAASLQRVRRIQSRSALIEQADLNPEEIVQLDELLSDFDDAFAANGEEVLMLVGQSEPPPARDLLGMTRDVTSVLYDAQLRLDALLGDRSGGVEPSATEIWNHLDLDRLEPAARQALQGAR